MENKNILLLRHHPMNVHFTNTFYTSQTTKGFDEYIPKPLDVDKVKKVFSKFKKDLKFVKIKKQ